MVKPQEAGSLTAIGARVTDDGAATLIGLIAKWRAQHAPACTLCFFMLYCRLGSGVAV